MSTNATKHVYEIIIDGSAERVWQALTDGEITQKYFFDTRVEANWKVGSTFHFYNQDGSLSSEGKILEIKPQSHLKTTWKPLWIGDVSSTLTWDIQSLGAMTLLKLEHTDVDDAFFAEGQFHTGWIYVLSNMKSVLEAGKPLPSLFG